MKYLVVGRVERCTALGERGHRWWVIELTPRDAPGDSFPLLVGRDVYDARALGDEIELNIVVPER